MAAPTEQKYHVNIRQPQPDMQAAPMAQNTKLYDMELKDAEDKLELIRQHRDQVALQKHKLEEQARQKHAFIVQQAEFSEKIISCLTGIDRGLAELDQEVRDLQDCRVSFAAHLSKIQKIDPHQWTPDIMEDRLEKAIKALDMAADDYDSAASHFQGSRSADVFGGVKGRSRKKRGAGHSSEFYENLKNGFAFNLSIIILGVIALYIHFSK